jgi:kynureninase
MRQTRLLVELLAAAGFELSGPLDPAKRGGTVTVRTPAFEAVHRELDAREILCDFRPDVGLRLGPHFFTTDDEIRFAVEQIVEIVESGVREGVRAATARAPS